MGLWPPAVATSLNVMGKAMAAPLERTVVRGVTVKQTVAPGQGPVLGKLLPGLSTKPPAELVKVNRKPATLDGATPAGKAATAAGVPGV